MPATHPPPQVTARAPGGARPRGAETTVALSALDLVELQIVYTTILARYVAPVAPGRLASGARGGLLGYLAARGLPDASLPYPKPGLDRASASDAIDTYVFDVLLRYGARVSANGAVNAALAGEAAALGDPYSLIFRPAAFSKFNAYLGTAGFGGIGAVLAVEPGGGRARVERVVAGSPAERAGVLAGDEIVAVDGRPLARETGDALVARLRGRVGTTVRVALLRSGAPLPAPLAIVRAVVANPLVTSSLLPGGVGYLALSRFGDAAAAQLAATLATLRARGARAYVLDLRDDGGGFGDEAKSVAGLLVGAGPVFTTRERGTAPSVERATGTPLGAPLAVLVNGDTASAAEIVAGAVQDDGAGAIVGTRTFGKGVVQSVYPLPDGGALKLTTGRYTTPKGRDIDGRGIAPDVTVAQPAGSVAGDPATDPQLARALEALGAPAATPGP